MKRRFKMNLTEDTTSSKVAPCFFCLQDSRIPKKTEPFSLRHISRFLKIFVNNDEEEILSENLKRKLYQFANDDSSMFICQNCSKMMEEFKELYHLMEVTKLRLKFCVQKMQHVMMMMTKSEEKSSIAQDGIQVDVDDVKLLKTLRKKTIDGMKKTTSRSHPKVMLRQTKVKLPRTTLSINAKISKKSPAIPTCTGNNYKASKKLNISNENSTKLLVPESNEDPCVTLLVAPATTTSISSLAKVPETSIKAPETTKCNKGSSRSVGKSQHKTGPSTATADTVTTMTTTTWNSTCQSQLLKVPTSCAKNNPKVSNETFFSTTDQTTTTYYSTASQHPPRKVSVKHKYVKCSLCRAKFLGSDPYMSQLLLRRHTLASHCEQLFPIQEHKLDHVTVPEYKKILNELLFNDFINGMETCPYCDERYINSLIGTKKVDRIPLIKSHLVEFHLTQIKERLIKIQKDPDLPKKLKECNPWARICECGVYIANLESQIKHLKLHCLFSNESSEFEDIKSASGGPPRQNTKEKVDFSESKSVCPFCRFEYFGNSNETKFTNFTMHLVTFHPEHYFTDVIEQFPSLTMDQFQRIMHNILFPELLPDSNTCVLLCQTSFQTKVVLKNHLIRYHINELKDRLRMILRDPDLQEKLKSFQDQGMSCPCGMYLPRKSSHDYHDKFHCNLKGRNGDDNDRSPSSSSRSSITAGVTKQNEVVWIPPKEDDLQDDDGINIRERQIQMQGDTNLSYRHEKFHCLVTGKTPKLEDRSPRENEKATFPETKRVCQLCRFEYSGKASLLPREMSKHLVTFHPEHFFTDIMDQFANEILSKDQFQSAVHNILFPELLPESHTCQLWCQKRFVNRIFLKKHLVSDHLNELKDRLRMILRDPNLNEKLKSFQGQRISCPCGMYLAQKSCQDYHDKFQCKLKDRIDDDHNIPSTSSRSNITPIKENDNDHDHQLKINDSCSLSSSNGGLNIPKTIVWIPPKEDDIQVDDDDNAKVSCPYCRVRLTRSQLDPHLLQYHGHHFFPKQSAKLDSISDSDFQKILVELLFKDVGVEEEKTSAACSYCDKTFFISTESESKKKKKACIFHIKFHLIQDHYKELEGKLLRLQRDPNLPKTLALCNPLGRMCKNGCGVYLPDVFSQGLHYEMHCSGGLHLHGDNPNQIPSNSNTPRKKVTSKLQDRPLPQPLKKMKSSSQNDEILSNSATSKKDIHTNGKDTGDIQPPRKRKKSIVKEIIEDEGISSQFKQEMQLLPPTHPRKNTSASIIQKNLCDSIIVKTEEDEGMEEVDEGVSYEAEIDVKYGVTLGPLDNRSFVAW